MTVYLIFTRYFWDDDDLHYDAVRVVCKDRNSCAKELRKIKNAREIVGVIKHYVEEREVI